MPKQSIFFFLLNSIMKGGFLSSVFSPICDCLFCLLRKVDGVADYFASIRIQSKKKLAMLSGTFMVYIPLLTNRGQAVGCCGGTNCQRFPKRVHLHVDQISCLQADQSLEPFQITNKADERWRGPNAPMKGCLEQRQVPILNCFIDFGEDVSGKNAQINECSKHASAK